MPKEQNGKTSTTNCIFCSMQEPDSSAKRNAIQSFFRNMQQIMENGDIEDGDDQELVLVLSGIWSIAMKEPENGDLPSLGIFKCMAGLINKSVRNGDWLLKNQNIYIPYYAAHIIGSYTISNRDFAVKAVESGVIPPLLDLLRGKMSWVEQRVAVRALGHLASYEETFAEIAVYEEEVVKLAMHLASSCVEDVYKMFVGVKDTRKRLEYHCFLLTRRVGLGDMEVENKKAEEWTSQLQSWCVNLLNCFAMKGRSLEVICSNPRFLQELCGIANGESPSGIGLIRLLCHSEVGRRCIGGMKTVVENLCNLCRSSDDWQYMGIDCLLLLLKDPETREKVCEFATPCLLDLIELKSLGGRTKVGETIRTTLYDLKLWSLCSTKKRRSAKEKVEEKRLMVSLIKQQGNHYFRLGRIQEAIDKYTEGLEFCPLRFKKERMVLYSNRAQCFLWHREADAAISDATRALCLSSPPNSHCKSLWRRSQAYDMMGLARESLMDCVVFINVGIRKGAKVPHFAVNMICKQMDATWIFRTAQKKMMPSDFGEDKEDDEHRMYEDKLANLRISTRKDKDSMASGLSTISEKDVPGNLKWRRKIARESLQQNMSYVSKF